LLGVSIVRTILTNPGNIPEEKEWDMQTDSMAESSSQSSDDGEVGFSSASSEGGAKVGKKVEVIKNE
jgi:hypothetical protein